MSLFGLFFVTFLVQRRGDVALYTASAGELHLPVGLLNTVVLLLSSYLVVAAVRRHRAGTEAGVPALLGGAIACAAIFGAGKAYEYTSEISAGNTPATNGFFTFYFVLTGLHLVHVIVGTALLAVWRSKSQKQAGVSRTFAESVAVYWHMVDLLWLIIFGLLYVVSIL